ncbi:MAG: nuclear transport factor 2 family protein [Dehalococcoidia bacterium]
MSDDARTHALLAKLEIIELTNKIGRAVDRCDVDLFCACFTDGGLFDSRIVSGPMPEAGRKMFATIRDSMRRTQHLVSNHIIVVDGDRAKGEASVIAMMFHDVEGAEQELVFGGRYLDEYVYEQGEWKVAARRIVVDYARTQKSAHSNAGAYEGTSFKGTNNKQDPSYQYVF